jgi:putative ABC transport system ATP-binding protein
MRDLNRQRGQTLVIVTHDPGIGDLCDRIVRMQDGLIVDQGIVSREQRLEIGDQRSETSDL